MITKALIAQVTHEDPVRNVAFTLNSRKLLTADDGGVVVMSSVPDGLKVASWRCHATSVSAIALADDYGTLVTAGVDGCVRAWALDVERPGALLLQAEYQFGGEVSGAALMPGGSGAFALSVQTGEVALWWPHLNKLEVIKRLPAQANSVAWSPDGTRLASGCDDCHVYEWSLVNDRTLTLRGHHHHADQLGYSACGRYLASGSHDRSVRVWDTLSGDCIAILPHRLDTVRPDWALDGRLLTCSYDQRVRVWKPLTGDLLAELHHHRYDVDDVAWSPDNRWIASAAWDHTARLYRADNYEQVAVIGGARNQIYALAVDASRRRVFVGTTGGRLYALDLQSRAAPHLLAATHHEGAVTSADVTSDGRWLATSGTDSTLILAGTAAPADDRFVMHSDHGLDIDVVRFSRGGAYLAVGDRNSRLSIYAVGRHGLQKLHDLPHERRVKALAWSSDGVLASGADGTVRTFEPLLGTVTAAWRAHERMINAVSWSADGSLIATACWDRLVRVFRRDGKLVNELAGHRYNVNGVEFSTEDIVATASWDGDVGLWNAATGRLAAMLTPAGGSPVNAIRWIPGSGSLLAAAADGSIVLIDGFAAKVTRSWRLQAISTGAEVRE